MDLESTRGFRGTKRYDVLIAAPLIVFYGFVVAGILLKLSDERRLLATGAGVMQFAAHAGNFLYLTLSVGLIFLRRPPVARLHEVWPRILAVVSGYMALGLVKLPAVTLPVWAMAVSAGLSLGGTVAATYVLFRLGRSFSIMPEARALVTTGPYRHIRHPLYLADFVASLGVMLQFAQPWAAALTAANLALQLWRMRYEERVLSRAFPDYAAYAARTWRLVPGLY